MAEQGKAFNTMTPDKRVTDPYNRASSGSQYPCHVHKWAGANEDGSPKLNDYLVVTNDAEKARALAEGWSLTPVLKEPKPVEPKKSPKGE